MTAPVELRSDCSRCAALCCIAYPAEEGPGFAATKQAGEPCPNLASCGSCTIYAERERSGFAGCVAYECFGAGQHVTQTFYRDRDWRSDPAILPDMVATFLGMRRCSDLLVLLYRIGSRRLTGDQARRHEAYTRELTELTTSRSALADEAAIGRLEKAVRGLVREIGR